MVFRKIAEIFTGLIVTPLIHEDTHTGNAGVPIARVNFDCPIVTLQRKVEGIHGAQEVIIDLKDVRYVDQSGAYALMTIIEDLQKDDGRVWVCGMHEEPRDMLRDLEVAPGLVPAERIFETLAETIEASGLKHGATPEEVKGVTSRIDGGELRARLAEEEASEAAESPQDPS